MTATGAFSLRLKSPPFESGGHTYAAVVGLGDHGVQILNITNPYDITAASSITDTDSLLLNGTVKNNHVQVGRSHVRRSHGI